MDPELKPCPFCGGEPHARGDGTLYWVICEDCDCEGPVALSPDDAAEKWNTRVVTE